VHADLGFVVFVALVAAQFFAVVLVNHEPPPDRSAGRPRTRREARTWNTWRLA
jgi:hypothetical protein